MNLLNRREMLRTVGAGAAMLTLPNLTLAQDKKGAFELPKLPYGFDALEPHIDARTMEIHHDKHHAAYVTNLNAAIAGSGLEGKSIEEVLANISKAPMDKQAALRNNGGGHYNHSLFWQMMSPKGGKPSDKLSAAIKEAFGDQDKMLAALKDAGVKRFGSGWAWVVVGKDGKLAINSTPNQDNALMDASGSPILGVDVWEHAYYLKYQNLRPAYIDAFFKVINWEFVNSLFDKAKKG